jgi:hypothetical protein
LDGVAPRNGIVRTGLTFTFYIYVNKNRTNVVESLIETDLAEESLAPEEYYSSFLRDMAQKPIAISVMKVRQEKI